MTTPRSQPTIAVDLTPVLPGGENGGAKVFALEWVRRLSALASHARFVLLTQAASHDELASLDRANVRRVLVVGAGASALRTRLARMAALVMRHVPASLRMPVARLGYRVHALLKRGGSGGLLKEIGADLLFCPFTAPTFHAPGIPTVCTVYDLQYLAYPLFFSIEDGVQRDRAFLDACEKATALAAISDYTRGAALRHGAVDANRVSTIRLRLAQPAPAKSSRQASVLDRLGVEVGKFLIYPANFWRHKNHEVLLTAFGIACSRIDADVKLVLTGTADSRQASIMEAARRMGLGDRVVYAGFLPLEDLVGLMAEAAGLVFPSLYEGFGIPVAEAMALGVPVACSNTTALPEVAGEAALYFDPRVPEQVSSSIVSLVEDEGLRARLIEAGRRRSVEFLDAERMASEYWALLQSAMAR